MAREGTWTPGSISFGTPAPLTKALLGTEPRWGVSKPIAAGLVTGSWSPQGPSPWKVKVKEGFHPRAGRVTLTLMGWEALSVTTSDILDWASRSTKLELKGVPWNRDHMGGGRRPVLPQAAQGTCPQLWVSPGEPTGVGGAAPEFTVAQCPRSDQVGVGGSESDCANLLNSTRGKKKRIGYRWFYPFAIFGILQLIFNYTTNRYMYFLGPHSAQNN